MININNVEKFVMEKLESGEYFPLRKEGWIELLTRLREAEKDAARYRWLRDEADGFQVSGCIELNGCHWDMAIDRVMKEKGDE